MPVSPRIFIEILSYDFLKYVVYRHEMSIQCKKGTACERNLWTHTPRSLDIARKILAAQDDFSSEQ